MILQAYDFLELNKKKNCVLQIGGSDQWGNIVNGVELIKRCNNKQTFGLTTPLITLASGAKMGKSEKGAIWLDKRFLSSYEYWQFWRNTDDNDVLNFLKMFTDLDINQIEKLSKEYQNINSLKILLANETTKMLHGETAAKKAQRTAKEIFQNKSVGSELITINVNKKIISDGINVIDFISLSKLFNSKSEIRRAIKNRGIRLNNNIVEDEKNNISMFDFDENQILKVSHGKKQHVIMKIN